MWKTEHEPARHVSNNDIGSFRLSVTAKEDGTQWQHVVMSFGEFSERGHIECLRTWPTEAIQILRNELNKLEAAIESEPH